MGIQEIVLELSHYLPVNKSLIIISKKINLFKHSNCLRVWRVEEFDDEISNPNLQLQLNEQRCLYIRPK